MKRIPKPPPKACWVCECALSFAQGSLESFGPCHKGAKASDSKLLYPTPAPGEAGVMVAEDDESGYISPSIIMLLSGLMAVPKPYDDFRCVDGRLELRLVRLSVYPEKYGFVLDEGCPKGVVACWTAYEGLEHEAERDGGRFG